MAITVRMYVPISPGVLSRLGSDLSEMSLSLGVFGNTQARIMKMMAARVPMSWKVALHPTISPTARPRGSPTIIATDEPVTIRLKAIERFPSGATLTANGVTIDQKIECAQATPILENISIPYEDEKPDNTWLAVKSATIERSSFLFSVFENAIIRGNEAIATTQA